MSGATIRIELDDASAQALLSRVAQGATSAAPLFTEIGSALEASTRQRIETTKVGPDGIPWLPLSAAWLKRKRDHGWAEGILTKRGDLLNSVAFEAHATYADIIAGPTEYAAIHQFGGKAGRNRAVEIPARPYLGVSDADAAEIREAAIEWLAGLIGR